MTSHTRQAESLRKADESRKSKREAKKERKAAEKASKANDINRLKAAKRQDILDKLKEQIQQISGKVAVDGVNLEGDFDEEQHQKMMQSMFDEDWYGQVGPFVSLTSGWNGVLNNDYFRREMEPRNQNGQTTSM